MSVVGPVRFLLSPRTGYIFNGSQTLMFGCGRGTFFDPGNWSVTSCLFLVPAAPVDWNRCDAVRSSHTQVVVVVAVAAAAAVTIAAVVRQS